MKWTISLKRLNFNNLDKKCQQMPKAVVFSYTKKMSFQRKLSTKNRIEKIYKWPPARPEVKLPESELLRNEINCLLVSFSLIFTLNVYTHLTIFIVYNPLLKLSLLWLWYRISKNNRWCLGNLMTWYFIQTSAYNRKRVWDCPSCLSLFWALQQSYAPQADVAKATASSHSLSYKRTSLVPRSTL